MWIFNAAPGSHSGAIHRARSKWKALRASNWILRILEEGAPLLFNKDRLPITPRTIKSFPTPEIARPVIAEWLSQALMDGDIAMSLTRPKVLSSIFVIPKKTPGEWRLCFDLRYINTFLNVPRFKHESIGTALRLAFKNCWFSKTDLKSSYAHVAVNPCFWKYLGFLWEGKWYHYRVLPFGLASSPFFFCKLLLPCIQSLRRQGLRICVFVDDILLISATQKEAVSHMLLLRSFLADLGWVISLTKSSCSPSQSIEFLGFNLDSTSEQISLPHKKRMVIIHEFRRTVIRSTRIPLPRRFLARITGLAAFIQPIEPMALCLSRPITELIKASPPSWSHPIFLNDEARSHLLLLSDILAKAPARQWFPPNWTHDLRSDASLTGFGSHLIHPEQQNHGTWESVPSLPSNPSINLLEILAAEKALLSHPWPAHSVIKLRLDNTVSIAYISKGTGRIPLLAQVAQRIALWAKANQILILPVHIPGVENVVADHLSRLTRDWSIPPSTFQSICSTLNLFPSIDRFATSNNTKLPRFNSRFPCSQACAIDAMSQNWTTELNYWAPPLAILEKVIHKITLESAHGILITPPWERPWLPALLSLSDAAVRIAPSEVISLGAPFEISSSGLIAWRIPGARSVPTSPKKLENWWFRLTSSNNGVLCSLG